MNGKHLLEIEVANQIANQIANRIANRIPFMDQEELPWRILHEINFVDIDYGLFDASEREMESSRLAGPLSLIPVDTSSKNP